MVDLVNILDARVKACPPAGEAGPVGTGMTAGVCPKWSASWPGKDPAIHVDHRVKPSDDGLRTTARGLNV